MGTASVRLLGSTAWLVELKWHRIRRRGNVDIAVNIEKVHRLLHLPFQARILLGVCFKGHAELVHISVVANPHVYFGNVKRVEFISVRNVRRVHRDVPQISCLFIRSINVTSYVVQSLRAGFLETSPVWVARPVRDPVLGLCQGSASEKRSFAIGVPFGFGCA